MRQNSKLLSGNLEKELEKLNLNLYQFSESKLNDQQIEEKWLCENSFYYFTIKAWEATRGTGSFIKSYHLEVICQHLEALCNLEIRRLIINCPFRVGKSTIGSVFFNPWVWTKRPNLSFLYTSYKEGLSVRDSVYARRLILSPWYQSLWGQDFRLMSDVNNKLRFENTTGGYRISSSVSGGNTGEGGHFDICFPYETMVETDQGEYPIGWIVEEGINCKVLSFNHETQQTEFKEIEEFHKNTTDEFIEIELEDGTILRCTPNHPIYIEGKGYISAEDVLENDEVLSLA
jgi:hypothetical protein